MKQVYKAHASVIFAFIILSVVMTFPVAWQFKNSVAGSGGDPWQTLWRFEDRLEALSDTWQPENGLNTLTFIRAEFLGGGNPRLINNSVWPWMPLHILFGEPAAYNIIWLASYVLSGYFMYLLVDWLISRYAPGLDTLRVTVWQIRVAPLLAGLFYAFWPYHAAHSLGHFGAMQTQWLPLAVLLTFVFLSRPTLIKALALAGIISMQSWSEHHYLLWLAFILICLVIYFWQDFGKNILAKTSRGPILLLGAAILFFGLLAWLPTFRLVLVNENPLLVEAEQTARFSNDLFTFLVPASFHPLWGQLFATFFSNNFSGNIFEATSYLGLVTLLVVLFFHQKMPRRQLIFWCGTFVFFLIISLGPKLHLLGFSTKIPLPYALLDQLPIFSAVRAVGRASSVAGLALAVLLGWTVATQVRRLKMAGVLASLLILDFLLLPVPMQATSLSQAYQLVGELPGEAIVELPAGTNYRAASRALYASNKHGKQVIGGSALERNDGGASVAELRTLPGLRQLLYLRTGALLENDNDFFAQDLAESLRDSLAYLQVGGILIHTDSVSHSQLAVVRNFIEKNLQLEPQEFSDAIVYPLSKDFFKNNDGIFLARDGAWQNVVLDKITGLQFAEIADRATITLYNINPDPQEIKLSFSFARASHQNLEITGSAEIIGLAQSVVGSQVSITLTMPSGQAQLVFKNTGAGNVTIINPVLELLR